MGSSTDMRTMQQERALTEYSEDVESWKDADLPYLEFWVWYARWCEENGLYNDRASYQ